MTAMISPDMGSCKYTLNRLRYTNRVKELSTHNGGASEMQLHMKTEGKEVETSKEG